ncbi:phosphate acetyltransferase [Leuconostoc gasicomitatum]|uniref:Phosphate acetyltransferase n=2 Tax=Leuconostoc TaxID=1243 RepID=A0AAN2QW44_9LACO|nr:MULTISPECIES: phosphate acetyltransferase [Leuconostoc]MBZ5956401.1 phosphate acetyltransferase [Leuconostoc gasicomitatum]MBZ5959639.1 phosphate acetyltransferase [Leuconostoc gasicomitatum]MBZ5963167.1 phosphate acetyltransferase [Leuconostoc gasicomitatum]MBZ5966372.1 phosphate acetyltransferase [Leuconostoc gasicomitatum]MBZ5979572.1 phosphate acetyltransferase [Leuconostoc gasicomitatum]
MVELFEQLKQKISGQNKVIVFPEGEDARIQGAAVRLANEGLIKPILLGNENAINATAIKYHYDLSNLSVIDPLKYDVNALAKLNASLVERRKGKTDAETAEKWLQDVNYFGTMLVYTGKADGMVSGATHPTGDTVRPALQIIKTAPGSSRISGAFIMQKGDERYVFSDAAININVDASAMAEIAIQSAQTAKVFDIEPKVAMLSFSTKGSAKSPLVDKVVEATKLAKEMAPELANQIDGELQFDAAFVASVGIAKAPESNVAGHANTFIFPSLESGNIGYKIAQRLGGYEAIGPILQGLAKPVSDLSRGANEEDVYKVAIITAAQALS